jgi:hypothetical protein
VILPHSVELRVPCPLSYVSFFFFSCLFIIHFIFVFPLFSLDEGQSVQEAMLMLICPREYCVPLICSSGVLSLPSSWELASGSKGALLVSLFNVVWGCYAQAGVWRCRSFASSWWFFLLDVSPASLQEFTLGSMLSASSL